MLHVSAGREECVERKSGRREECVERESGRREECVERESGVRECVDKFEGRENVVLKVLC